MRLIDADYLKQSFSKKWYWKSKDFSSGVLETMDFVMKKIDDAPTVPTFGHWISVNDRLPEDGHFLVCHKGGEVYMDYMTEFYRPKFKKVDATSYWMPLPESPKEDKQ